MMVALDATGRAHACREVTFGSTRQFPGACQAHCCKTFCWHRCVRQPCGCDCTQVHGMVQRAAATLELVKSLHDRHAGNRQLLETLVIGYAGRDMAPLMSVVEHHAF